MNSTTSETPTVFLVDDDDRIRISLARALEKRGYSVTTFASAEAFLKAHDSGQPGCLVLDYGMPGLNGLELQKQLIFNNVAIPIIFISGHGGISESVQAMKAGAVDFLEKPFRQETLIACIEAAFKTDSEARAAQAVSKSTHERFSRLTAREQEVAWFMIENSSNTSSKEIGRQLSISPRTVDHHRARILEKMEIKSVAQLIDLSASVELQQECDLNSP
ncbi:response regulator transcription factor [Sulfitobacter sp.]|uniref:response regulator transcription factor n=1 Tax=Sulfitobacter sp. TaxID=1903071 RepID=UPI003F6AD68A